MAAKDTAKSTASRANTGKLSSPPSRLRTRLNTIEDVKKEMARLYREARAKKVDSQDASRLANMLSMLGRLIEGSEIQRDIDELRKAIGQTQATKGNKWPSRA